MQNEPRLCLQCKAPIVRRDNESAWKHAERKYCSKPCARMMINPVMLSDARIAELPVLSGRGCSDKQIGALWAVSETTIFNARKKHGIPPGHRGWTPKVFRVAPVAPPLPPRTIELARVAKLYARQGYQDATRDDFDLKRRLGEATA